MLITPAEYAASMRRLEAMRNEALHHRDRSALVEIGRRAVTLTSVFFGRDPDRRRPARPAIEPAPPRETGTRPVG